MKYSYSRTYRGEIRAVLTDLAGTTVDFGSCAPAGAFVKLFAEAGITLTAAQARGPMGLHKRDHIATLAALPDVAAQWDGIHGKACCETDIDALYETFIPMQVAALPDYTDLIPGVIEALAGLGEMGVRVAATTGYNREMMHTVLRGVAAQGFVPEVAICAEDVPMGRPAPWMNFRAMEALGVYPREAVVAIGDTLPDIESALNAGVWAVGVSATGNMLGCTQEEYNALNAGHKKDLVEEAEDRMYAVGAHFVIPGFGDVPQLIMQLNRLLSQGKKP